MIAACSRGTVLSSDIIAGLQRRCCFFCWTATAKLLASPLNFYCRDSYDELSALSLDQGQEERLAVTGGQAASGSMALEVVTAAATPPLRPDNLSNLLGVLAAVYGIYPGENAG